MWFRARDIPHVTSFTRPCRGFGLLPTPQRSKGQESSHFKLFARITRGWEILNTASVRDYRHMHTRLRYTTKWKISLKRWVIFKSTGCHISIACVQLQFLDKVQEAQIIELCKTVLVGTAVAQWLRCCATNRKVAGSIPAGVSGFFIEIKYFRSHYGPGVDSASNRNEYQEYFLGVKAAGA